MRRGAESRPPGVCLHLCLGLSMCEVNRELGECAPGAGCIYSRPCISAIVIPIAQLRAEAREGKQLLRGHEGTGRRAQGQSWDLRASLFLLSSRPTAFSGEGGEGQARERGVNSFHKPFPLGFQVECPLEKQFSSNRYVEKPRE